MPRMARVIAAGQPHHITQRGNRRCEVFFAEADYRKYLSLLSEYCKRYDLAIWAYCLMPNHVHFVAVPSSSESLSGTFRDTHQAYSSWLNRKMGESGHLWQGRFFSCVLDEAHLWSAVRYVERNPVRAGLVKRAEDYPWSSAAGHCGLRQDAMLSGQLERSDHVGNWRAMLREPGEEAEVALLRKHTRTGRPCGDAPFVERLESVLGRKLRPQKRGPKPKRKERRRGSSLLRGHH